METKLKESSGAIYQTQMQDYFAKRVKCYRACYSVTRSTILNALYGLGWFPMRLTFRHTMDYLPSIKAQSVLDIGCGCGAYSAELAKRGAVVTAVDICREMIDATEALLEQQGLSGQVRIVLADYLDWSAGIRQEYDLALAVGVLDYTNDAGEYLASFKQIAREAIITFPAKSLFSLAARIGYGCHGVRGYFYTEGQVKDLLHAVGLEPVSLSRLFPGTYWVHARCNPEMAG